MNTLETVHDNHRERVRQKFAAQGFTGWHDHEILELFLFYVMPRVDTNPTAHALIDEFGTLAQVLDADVDALKRVRGVGETTALYLHALGRLPSVYAQSKWDGKKTVLLNATATSLFCPTRQKSLLSTSKSAKSTLLYGFFPLEVNMWATPPPV